MPKLQQSGVVITFIIMEPETKATSTCCPCLYVCIFSSQPRLSLHNSCKIYFARNVKSTTIKEGYMQLTMDKIPHLVHGWGIHKEHCTPRILLLWTTSNASPPILLGWWSLWLHLLKYKINSFVFLEFMVRLLSWLQHSRYPTSSL